MLPDTVALRSRWPRGLLLAGCATIGVVVAACSAMGAAKHTEEAAISPAERPPSDAVQLASCVETLDRLAHGTPTQQAEILSLAKQAADRAPQLPFEQLRYALVLAQSGHPGSNSTEARVRLRQLALATLPLGGLAHDVALLELQQLDREAALLDETRRLGSEVERAERDKVAPLTRRLQVEIEENARLHRALDEAHAKLDAIMNIERSITERKPAGEVKRQ